MNAHGEILLAPLTLLQETLSIVGDA
jgi:hypothetical protein